MKKMLAIAFLVGYGFWCYNTAKNTGMRYIGGHYFDHDREKITLGVCTEFGVKNPRSLVVFFDQDGGKHRGNVTIRSINMLLAPVKGHVIDILVDGEEVQHGGIVFYHKEGMRFEERTPTTMPLTFWEFYDRLVGIAALPASQRPMDEQDKQMHELRSFMLMAKMFGADVSQEEELLENVETIAKEEKEAAMELLDNFQVSIPTAELKRLAARNLSFAQFHLGYRYLYSKQDHSPLDAEKWLKEASDNGSTLASFWLGIIYHSGEYAEIPRNRQSAYEYFSRAALKGHADSLWYVGIQLLDGDGVRKDIHKARLNFAQAAGLGHADGQYFLARFYARGIDVEKDMDKAVDLYKKAAAQGHERAAKALADLGFDTQPRK